MCLVPLPHMYFTKETGRRSNAQSSSSPLSLSPSRGRGITCMYVEEKRRRSTASVRMSKSPLTLHYITLHMPWPNAHTRSDKLALQSTDTLHAAVHRRLPPFEAICRASHIPYIYVHICTRGRCAWSVRDHVLDGQRKCGSESSVDEAGGTGRRVGEGGNGLGGKGRWMRE